MLKKIPVTQLTTGMFIHGFERGWMDHPFWRTKFVVKDEATLCKVRESGVEECWIDVEQGRDVAVAVVASCESALTASDIREPQGEAATVRPPASTSMAQELQHAAVLRQRSKLVVSRIFEEARLGNAVEPSACAPLVNEVVESINRNPDAFVSLARLKVADEYTYMHSVAVCALMVALGRQLGFDEDQCRDAGLAGMFHDLGKAAMPQDILNKPGKLTAEEFEIIKQHPVRGYEMLLAGGTQSEGMLDVCRHHHERMDGKGYPDALADEQISLLARMGAVCDVYDAVTSNRPYKAGWDPAEAIAQMASWKGHFDARVFQAFVKSVGIYPTGSLVRMTSGRLGVVVEQNAAKLTAPKVKVFYSTKAALPIRPAILDLSARMCRDQIQARESPANWQFIRLNELWAGELAL